MARVAINPDLLTWASERSGTHWEALLRRFSGLSHWANGSRQPTISQLTSFAAATQVAVGQLLLPEPPAEELPLPDFRTQGNVSSGRPSGDLLDVIYDSQIRQSWYRDYAASEQLTAADWVGSRPEGVSEATKRLSYAMEATRGLPNQPREALKVLTDLAEAHGILVMASGVVGNNTRRRLSVAEFRGFVIADERAPLIFLNAADSLRAQVFTLVHEMAHLLRRESAVSSADPAAAKSPAAEWWCNRVAAEFLVPAARLATAVESARASGNLIEILRLHFPVSATVAMIRAHELDLIGRRQLDEELERGGDRAIAATRKAGGNFYNTQGRRLGQRFPRAVVTSVREGRLAFLDGMRLLGLKNERTYDRFAAHLEAE